MLSTYSRDALAARRARRRAGANAAAAAATDEVVLEVGNNDATVVSWADALSQVRAVGIGGNSSSTEKDRQREKKEQQSMAGETTKVLQETKRGQQDEEGRKDGMGCAAISSSPLKTSIIASGPKPSFYSPCQRWCCSKRSTVAAPTTTTPTTAIPIFGSNSCGGSDYGNGGGSGGSGGGGGGGGDSISISTDNSKSGPSSADSHRSKVLSTVPAARFYGSSNTGSKGGNSGSSSNTLFPLFRKQKSRSGGDFDSLLDTSNSTMHHRRLRRHSSGNGGTGATGKGVRKRRRTLGDNHNNGGSGDNSNSSRAKSNNKTHMPPLAFAFGAATLAQQQQQQQQQQLQKPPRMRQAILDLGQRNIHTTCAVCGMFYAPGDDGDRRAHARYHEAYELGVPYAPRPPDRLIVREVNYGEDLILRVTSAGEKMQPRKAGLPSSSSSSSSPSSSSSSSATVPPALGERARQVREMMDKSLGAASAASAAAGGDTLFLYLSGGRFVGCVAAERIRRARRVMGAQEEEEESVTMEDVGAAAIPPNTTTTAAANNAKTTSKESLLLSLPSSQSSEDKGFLQVSGQLEAASIGISRMWVLPGHRRKGIARALVDCARSHLVFAHIPPRSAVAFSAPTPAGRAFARRYTQQDDFYVYTDADLAGSRAHS